MNLKSIICSGFLHITILGVGITGGGLWTSRTSFKHPKTIEIAYVSPIKASKSNEHKIETSKNSSLCSKNALQKRVIVKSVESSYSKVKKHEGYISSSPHLGDYLRLPPLIYPESARQNQQEGEVELEISLDKQGCVRHVEVLKSADVTLLNQAAIDTFHGKCIVSQPGLFTALNNQKLILPIRFYLQ